MVKLKLISILLLFSLSLFFLGFNGIVLAENGNDGNGVEPLFERILEVGKKGGVAALGEAAGETAPTPASVVGTVIKYVLGLVGVIFTVLVVAGGIMWMTAGGNDEQVKKARQIITRSLIGVLIAVAAYTLTYFIVDVILKAVLGGGKGLS